MHNLGINIDAYQNMSTDQVVAGSAQTSPEALNDLSKALEAGSLSGNASMDQEVSGSGAPLKVESLDNTLKLITYKESEIVLWRKIPKSPAYSTVEEYAQLSSYGADRGGFVKEGELPQSEDSTYIRRSQLVKFLGVTKEVTHVMTLQNAIIGNKIAQEAKNGTMWILRKVNKALWQGDANVIPDEFNGLYAQHGRPDGSNWQEGSQNNYLDSELVIDLRGDYLKEEDLEEAQQSIIENHGIASDAFGSPRIFADFAKGLYAQKRYTMNSAAQADGYGGLKMAGTMTEFGPIDFSRDIFMNKPKHITSATAATSSSAPTAPVASSIAAVAPTVTGTKWDAADAGDYLYAVTAINRYGESAPTVLDAAATTILSGGAVDLTFTAGAGGEAATGYTIYRGEKGVTGAATKFYKLFDVSTADLAAGYNGGAAGVIRDLNRYMANTQQMFVIDNSADVWTFRQFAPLMKMDLAITSPSYRFMVLLYGTPLLMAQRKMVRIINIGSYVSA